MANRWVKAECLDCGYVARTSAKWLDRRGAPLCPCNGRPMFNAREAAELDAEWDRGEAERAAGGRKRIARNARHVRIRSSRECRQCGRFHDAGALMATFEAGRDRIYVCPEPQGCAPDAVPDYSGDALGWTPGVEGTDVSEWF